MDDLWRRARRAADAAHILFDAENYDGACNRAYYAMFNSARARLVQKGIRPRDVKTHATVLRLFSLHFVQEGIFDAAAGRALSQAGKTRIDADYSTNDVGLEAVRNVMNSLDLFMRTAEKAFYETGDR